MTYNLRVGVMVGVRVGGAATVVTGTIVIALDSVRTNICTHEISTGKGRNIARPARRHVGYGWRE